MRCAIGALIILVSVSCSDRNLTKEDEVDLLVSGLDLHGFSHEETFLYHEEFFDHVPEHHPLDPEGTVGGYRLYTMVQLFTLDAKQHYVVNDVVVIENSVTIDIDKVTRNCTKVAEYSTECCFDYEPLSLVYNLDDI